MGGNDGGDDGSGSTVGTGSGRGTGSPGGTGSTGSTGGGAPAAQSPGQNLALYRKYRSATFAEVIGQEHVTEPLRHALANGRINHAYLFSGPRGCGKTSSARILARSLNCAQGPTPDPCGVCASCLELAPNGPGSIDVIEIDAASHGGVDDARDLRERAFFAPVRDRFKVYIIDEAHMVTTQGFNALLKLVEEPPDFLVFVFATTEPDKVLTTIRSRTHHYPFRLIPPGAMRAHLEAICAAEKIIVEPTVLPLVVRAGGGSARDALSILDQLLAGAGPDGVTYARAVALLGVTDGALLDDMVDALAAGDAASVYGAVDSVVEAGHDPRRFAADLLDRFRDLILLDAVPDAASRGLIDAPQDQVSRMTDQAIRLGGGTLTRFAEIIHTALIEMRGTTSPRLVLELLCARMQLPDASADAAALLQRIERLERRFSASGATVADATPAEESRPSSRQPAPSRPALSPTTPPITPPTTPTDAPAPPPARSQQQLAQQQQAQPQQAQQRPSQARPAQAERAPWPTPPASLNMRPAPEPADPATSEQQPAASSAVSAPPSVPATPPAAPAAPPAPPAVPAAPPAAPAVPESAAAARVAAAGELDAAQLRRLWPEVLDRIRDASKTIWAMLDGSQIATADGNLVTLAVSPSLAKRIAEERNAAVIGEAFTRALGGSWRVAVVPAGPAGSSGSAGVTPRDATPARQAPSAPLAEPDPRDDPDFDEDGPGPARAVIDPEAEALKLLQDQLGARPVEDR